VASLSFEKALVIAVTLALALAMMPLATARGGDEPVNALLHVEVKVHYTHALVTYNITLRGPAALHQMNVSLPSWDNLYASVCGGDYSRSWIKDIQLKPNETYSMIIESLWSMSVEGNRHVLRIPLNPLMPPLSADRVEVVIFPPPNASSVDVRDLNFTKADDALKLDIYNFSLREARTITLDLAFNASVYPWLFKVKKLVRDVDPLSGTIVDYVTVESLSPTMGWQIGASQRQSVFCFKFPSEVRILEVGDLASSFDVAQSEQALRPGSYALSSTNDFAILYVRLRTSLALGERATVYIKYSTPDAKALRALPKYVDYADEVELRFRVPPGSVVLRASPEPERRDKAIYYKFYTLSCLQNPIIVVEVSPPSAPQAMAVVVGIAGAAIALGIVIGKRIATKRAAEAEVDFRPFKELFDNYANIARRVWGAYEGYLRGKVKDLTYEKQIRGLRLVYLEASKKLTEASKKFERSPKLGKLVQRISELVSKASRLEEEMSSFEAVKRGKRITAAELSQRAEELMKKIEGLRKELHDLSLKITKARA